MVSDYSLFVVSRDGRIECGQISWHKCEITLVEIPKETTADHQTSHHHKNMVEKVSSQDISGNIASTVRLDHLSQLLYQAIDELLVQYIQSSRFYLGEFHLKGLIGGQSIHWVGQSLHIQGESEQALGVYLKSLEAHIEKTKILGVSKLILVCPFQFGELSSPREHVRICVETIFIDLSEKNMELVLQCIVYMMEKDGEPMSWEPWKEYLGNRMLQVDVGTIRIHCPYTIIRLSHFRIAFTLHQGWSCSIQKIEIQDTTPREWNYIAYSQGELTFQQQSIDTYSLKKSKKLTKWVGKITLPRLILNLDEFWVDLWMKYLLHLYLPMSKLMHGDEDYEATADGSDFDYIQELAVSPLELCVSFKSRNTLIKDLPKYMYQGEWLKCLQLSSLHDAKIKFSKITLVDVGQWKYGISKLSEVWLLELEKQGARLVSQLDGWKHLFSILRHIPNWKKVIRQPIRASVDYTKNVSGDVLDLCTRTLVSIDKMVQTNIFGKTISSDTNPKASYFSEAPTSWKKGLQKAIKTKNILKSGIYILSGFHSSLQPEKKINNQLRYKKKDDWYNVGDVSIKK